jgi:hypothetical protein
VIVVDRESIPDGHEILLGWLRARGKAVLEGRMARASKGKAVLGSLEALGQIPDSAAGLIAYIGFDH